MQGKAGTDICHIELRIFPCPVQSGLVSSRTELFCSETIPPIILVSIPAASTKGIEKAPHVTCAALAIQSKSETETIKKAVRAIKAETAKWLDFCFKRNFDCTHSNISNLHGQCQFTLTLLAFSLSFHCQLTLTLLRSNRKSVRCIGF